MHAVSLRNQRSSRADIVLRTMGVPFVPCLHIMPHLNIISGSSCIVSISDFFGRGVHILMSCSALLSTNIMSGFCVLMFTIESKFSA